MNDFFSTKILICRRTVWIFGLLAGLLFSNGEGIRLLPFPSSEISRFPSSEFKENSESNYQKNIHRIESRANFYQEKSQQKHCTDLSFSLNISPFRALENRQKELSSVRLILFQSEKLTAQIGSRAPPLV
jgi:hypothetical protein